MALLDVPFGGTVSYAAIAERIREAKGVGAGEEVIGKDAQASAAVALLSPMTEEAAAFLSQRTIQMWIQRTGLPE